MTITSPATPAEVTRDLTDRVTRRLTANPSKPLWPGSTVLREVDHGEQPRRADVLVINHYNGKPKVVGVEIKATRTDWLKELHEPAKAEAWIPWCEEWWIVAPEGVVAEGELPAGWGLLVPVGNARLKVVVAATPRKVEMVPMWLLVEVVVKCNHRRAESVSTVKRELESELYEARQAVRLAGPRTPLEQSIEEDAAMFGQLLDLAGMSGRRWSILRDGLDSDDARTLITALSGLRQVRRETAAAQATARRTLHRLAAAVEQLGKLDLTGDGETV